ncbi:MAG: hypothetical protein AAB871_03820, partial [Patescibacteria group bacterium]
GPVSGGLTQTFRVLIFLIKLIISCRPFEYAPLDGFAGQTLALKLFVFNGLFAVAKLSERI